MSDKDEEKEMDALEDKIEALKVRIKAGDASEAMLAEIVTAAIETLDLMKRQRNEARADAEAWKARYEGLKEGVTLVSEGFGDVYQALAPQIKTKEGDG